MFLLSRVRLRPFSQGASPLFFPFQVFFLVGCSPFVCMPLFPRPLRRPPHVGLLRPRNKLPMLGPHWQLYLFLFLTFDPSTLATVLSPSSPLLLTTSFEVPPRCPVACPFFSFGTSSFFQPGEEGLFTPFPPHQPTAPEPRLLLDSSGFNPFVQWVPWLYRPPLLNLPNWGSFSQGTLTPLSLPRTRHPSLFFPCPETRNLLLRE